jgi:hypothetical protein
VGPNDILRNSGFAFNPATGKYEQAYAKSPLGLDEDYSDFSFDPTGRASLAGWAPGYYTDNGNSMLRNLLTEALPLFAGAVGAGAGASALGAGAMGGAAAGEAGAAAGGSAASEAGLGAAAAGGEETGGAGMWDWLDDVGLDEYGNTGGNFAGGSEATDVGAYDAGMGDFLGLGSPADVDAMGGGSGGFDAGMADYLGMGNPADTVAVGNVIPGMSPSLWNRLTNAGTGLASRLLGSGRAAAGGGGKPGGAGGMSLGEAAFDSTPFLLAAYLANKQRNDINPYLDRLNTLNDRFAGNESPYIKSLTDPYDMATARGRGALTMSLGNRNVWGPRSGITTWITSAI